MRRARRALSISEWAIRHFRLAIPKDAKPEAPGLLLIQIDGLAKTQLERALRQRKMPFLKRLLRRQHYELKDTYSGVPSTTPAVQGELFYGVKCIVPAFSFLDRTTRRMALMFNPDSVKPIEEKLRQQGEGLLKDGSSWSNIYCGGACTDDSHICAASIGFGDMLRSRSALGFFAMILLQVPLVLRIIGLLIVELVLGLWDVVDGLIRFRAHFKKEISFVCNRIFVSIGLREVITFGARIDLARGLPIVHVNFLGYDEQSHRRGPGSAFAHWSLRGIDKCIERLYLSACRSHRRDYQVWIFSDHGQERTRLISEMYQGGLGPLLHDAWEEFEKRQQARNSRSTTHNSRAMWAGGKRAERHFQEQTSKLQLSKEEEESFCFAALGPLGHVYFARELSFEEKKRFAELLVHKFKVPGVVFKTEPGHAVWILESGLVRLPEQAIELLPHRDELKAEVANDITCLCHNEYAGDIILTGWAPHRAPVTFEEERGAHGGPGPEETRGFLLVPANTRFPASVTNFVRPIQLREAALHALRRQRLPGSRSRAATTHLRVMTYNVHGCLGMDGKISPHRIAQVIARYSPDIVALQEVDVQRLRSRQEDQVGAIAQELGMHSYFCPAISDGNEHYGDAILSRHPLKIVRAENIAADPENRDPEPRGAIWTRMELDGIPIHILNTHFGLGSFERVAQAMDLLSKKWIGGIDLNEPIILCGDFNMFPKSIAYRHFTSRLHDVQQLLPNHRALKTFSTMSPVFRIDHIFVSAHFLAVSINVPRTDLTRVASDHLPLVAELRFDERHLRTVPRFHQREQPRLKAEALR